MLRAGNRGVDAMRSAMRAWLSAALVMRVLAAGFAFCLVVLALASPEIFDRVVRGGEPMEALSRTRLDLLRAALAPFAAAGLAFCLAHRRAADWRPLRILVFALPLAALAVVVAYKLAFGSADPRYLMFIREDGPVEYATALVFLVGTVVAWRAAALAHDRQATVFLALFGAGMLFVALSEISFGQRLLGLETPEVLMEVNRQHEISLHNIYGVEFVVYGIMPHVIFAYALFSRAAARRLAGTRLSPDLLAVAPFPWYTVSWFLPMAIFSAKQVYLGAAAVFQDQEPSELFVGIGFLLAAFNAWLLLGRSAPPRPAPARLPGDHSAPADLLLHRRR